MKQARQTLRGLLYLLASLTPALEQELHTRRPHLLQWWRLTRRLHSRWQLEQAGLELLGCSTGAKSLQGALPRSPSSRLVAWVVRVVEVREITELLS